MPRLLTVFGATGNQGGSVVAVISSNPDLRSKYSIRAVTRNPTSAAAAALRAKGCEVVTADLKDLASVKQAVSGSYAVFGMTNFWEIHNKEGEIKQGKVIADASRDSGVKHLVWSSLPHASKLTNGTLTQLQHFDSKAEVEEHIENTKGDMVATYYRPAGFMTNFRQSINPGPDGVPTYFAPLDPTNTKFPVIDVATDTGKYVAGILEAGPGADGAHVNGVGEWLSPKDITDTITAVTGKTVKFVPVPPEAYKKFLPEPIAEEITENMLLIRDYSYYGLGSENKKQDSDRFLLKGEALTKWEDFVRRNGPWSW